MKCIKTIVIKHTLHFSLTLLALITVGLHTLPAILKLGSHTCVESKHNHPAVAYPCNSLYWRAHKRRLTWTSYLSRIFFRNEQCASAEDPVKIWNILIVVSYKMIHALHCMSRNVCNGIYCSWLGFYLYYYAIYKSIISMNQYSNIV